LTVHEKFRNVRSAKEDCAGTLETVNRYRIGGGLRILELRHAPGTRLALDAEAFLNVDRDALKNANASCGVAGNGLIGLFGRFERLVAQLIHVCIQLRLKRIDAPQSMLRQFDRRNLACADGRCRVECRSEVWIEFSFHEVYKGLLSLPGSHRL